MSILNDGTFDNNNSVKHTLHQQFRVLDPDYGCFLDLIHCMQPTQAQLDKFQEVVILCRSSHLDDEDISAFSQLEETSVMTISRTAAQQVNNIMVGRLFKDQRPLSLVLSAALADGEPILPYRGMKIIITENWDKSCRIVNGQDATFIHSHGTVSSSSSQTMSGLSSIL